MGACGSRPALISPKVLCVETLRRYRATGSRRLAVFLDHEPVLAAVPAIFPVLHADEMPPPGQPLPVKAQPKVAFSEPRPHGLQRLPPSQIEQHHRSGAVIAFGDLSLEAEIGQRVILGAHRQSLFGRIERGPLRNGPAEQHALPFEPQVEMGALRGVLLHGVPQGEAGRGSRMPRLIRLFEIAPREVTVELCHRQADFFLPEPELADFLPRDFFAPPVSFFRLSFSADIRSTTFSAEGASSPPVFARGVLPLLRLRSIRSRRAAA